MNDEVVQIRPKRAEPLKVGNQTFKSAYDWELSERDLEKAAVELGETEEKKETCIRKLKEKLSNIFRRRNMNDGVIQILPRRAEPLKIGNQTFKSAYNWILTERDLKKAAEELGETEEKKLSCLRKLKEKLAKDSSIKYRQDDFYLLRFLRIRKYDVKRAYQNVRSFFELRKKHSDFFTLPQDLTSLQKLKFFSLLPYATEEGATIIWMDLDRWNPAERRLEEMIPVSFTVWDIASMNPHCQIDGIIVIYNLRGLTMKHISEALWNGRLFTLISLGQSGYPWRIKNVFLLNTNRLVRFIYSIVKPFMNRKVSERVFLLGSDMNELHQHVNPVLLPKSLDGDLEDEACDISQHVLDNLPYLRYERTFIFE